MQLANRIASHMRASNIKKLLNQTNRDCAIVVVLADTPHKNTASSLALQEVNALVVARHCIGLVSLLQPTTHSPQCCRCSAHCMVCVAGASMSSPVMHSQAC